MIEAFNAIITQKASTFEQAFCVSVNTYVCNVTCPTRLQQRQTKYPHTKLFILTSMILRVANASPLILLANEDDMVECMAEYIADDTKTHRPRL